MLNISSYKFNIKEASSM